MGPSKQHRSPTQRTLYRKERAMMKKLCWISLLSMAACVPVTVNLVINFPEKKLEGALDKMEGEIRKEKEPPAPEEDKKQGKVFPQRNVMAVHNVRFQDDKDIDIDVSTPQIQDLKKRREARFSQLKPHFQAGRLGEGKDALVATRHEDGLDGKGKGAMRKVVREENDDRQALIREIARANNIDENHIERVRRIYARVMRKYAESGWWVQEEDGSWKKK